jgi:hypothetical protein
MEKGNRIKLIEMVNYKHLVIQYKSIIFVYQFKTDSMAPLVTPNDHYVNVVSRSRNYLNNPKYWLNQALESMFRHWGLIGIEDYLTHYKFNNVKKLALDFYNWRSKLTHKDAFAIIVKDQWNFNKMTEYPDYIQSLDKQMSLKDNTILEERWSCGVCLYKRFDTFNYIQM